MKQLFSKISTLFFKASSSPSSTITTTQSPEPEVMEKRYDNKTHEPKLQQWWLEHKTYTTENNPGQLYSIDTPPPTVSGKLHIGHIFSYTQTDILARYKRMNGFSVFYPFGFDDNGLPTERYVEKKRKVRGHTLPRSEFIQMCIEASKEAEHEFTTLWQRMGLSADWSKTYSTISDQTRKISQASFIELYNKGFIYRKQEPALYCTNCRTSVAQAELDDVEEPSFFNNIVFKDKNDNDLIIGTTRPELLPSCVALLYNPADERYRHLKGQLARVPLFEQQVPIIEDELVEIDKGTGLVMVCTFGDKTDIIWYKKYDLPYRESIGLDGKFIKGSGILEGLKVAEARQKMLQKLGEKSLLISQKPITHAVNVHERCKKEIEYVELPQWFVKILEHKQTFLDLADQIKWSPEFMKARYKNWVENLGWDWCISRQRFYGIPFPVWHCDDCGEILLADKKDLPIDPQETTYPGACTKCQGSNISPDTDVMDTWNTSSLSPYICYDLYTQKTELPFDDPDITQFLPMSNRPQAHDIIRTWAFYTIIKTWMHHNIIPWKNIVISGHVLSDKHEKLSKSKANTTMEPEKLLERFPADAIRYWTASGSLGHDTAFSEDQIKQGTRLITKLWNAFRFVSSHITQVQPEKMPEQFGVINEWLLDTVTKTFEQYKAKLDTHEAGLALQHLEDFFWADFCDNYLEMVKHQLFNPHEYDAKAVYATQWTLHHVGMRILQCFAPYIPHVTETIYQLFYAKQLQKESLHQTNFEKIQVPYLFEKETAFAELIISVISQVRKLKSESQLSLKTPLATLTIYVDNIDTLDKLVAQEQLLRGVTQAEEIIVKESDKTTPKITEKDGMWHAEVIAKQPLS